jgi:hypothetical protein
MPDCIEAYMGRALVPSVESGAVINLFMSAAADVFSRALETPASGRSCELDQNARGSTWNVVKKL